MQKEMIACVDVQYRPEGGATVACVLLSDWGDAKPARELVREVAEVAPYEPGQFYKREMPCVLAILADIPELLSIVVIDGYVWLGPGEGEDTQRPGLGARLYDALEGRLPVVGVAKTAFQGAEAVATPVLRGESRAPLYVTAVGIEAAEAAQKVGAMHGPHRLPTALKRVDQLCRQASAEQARRDTAGATA